MRTCSVDGVRPMSLSPPRRKLSPSRSLQQRSLESLNGKDLREGSVQVGMAAPSKPSLGGDLLDDSSRSGIDSDVDDTHARLIKRMPDLDTSVQRRNSGQYLTRAELDHLIKPTAPSEDCNSSYALSDYSDDDSQCSDSDDDSSQNSADSSDVDSDDASFSAAEGSFASLNLDQGQGIVESKGGEESDAHKKESRRTARRSKTSKKSEGAGVDAPPDTGRPELARKLSNRDLVAQMNTKIPSKKNLLKEIRSIVPFADRKTRNLKKDSNTNDKSHFVTGSRIRRFVGGVEVVSGRTYQECNLP